MQTFKLIFSRINDYSEKQVTFQVLAAASMKMTFVWEVAPYSVVEITGVSEVLTASTAPLKRR
jgi:hypothetical protein